MFSKALRWCRRGLQWFLRLRGRSTGLKRDMHHEVARELQGSGARLVVSHRRAEGKHSCLPNGDVIDWRSPGESKHHLTESAQTPETTSSVTSNRQNQNRAWDNSPYPPWGKCMGRCLRKHLQRSSSSCSQSRSPSFPTPSKNRQVLVHT